MKNNLQVLFFVFFISVSINAQVAVGLEAGLNRSNTLFEGSTDIQHIKTFQYYSGIVPNYSFQGNVSISALIGYSLEGYRLENSGGTDLVDFKYAYINFIPELEYRVHRFLSLGLGCYYAQQLFEEYKFPNAEWQRPGRDGHAIESFKNIDFGPVISIKPRFGRFYFNARMKYGLMDILDITFTYENGDILYENIKNFNLQLGLGYQFIGNHSRKKKK